MNVGELVEDALRYPLSDWKKVLIYGFIGLFTTTAVFRGFFALNGLTNPGLILIVVIFELLVSIYFTGYFLKIIKLTLTGTKKLPQFNAVTEKLSDGIKVFIVAIVYMIPVILIIVFFAVLSSSALQIIVNHAVNNGFNLQNIITILMSLGIGIGIFLAMLYMVVVLPLFIVSLVHMADNNDKLTSAFRLGEIFDKIGKIGWFNLILWYLASGLIFIAILVFLGTFILAIFNLIHNIDIGGLLISVVLIPYLYMYFARSSALFYTKK
jgi:Protein of unknown function (DUF4013)